MKVQMKVGSKVIVEAEGDSPKQVFERVAALAGIFGAAGKCGCCGCPEIVPQVRQPQGFTYYELVCLNPDCGATLTFGQNKEGGGLFPKRERGQNGWEVYQGPAQGVPAGPVGRGRPAPRDDDGPLPY